MKNEEQTKEKIEQVRFNVEFLRKTTNIDITDWRFNYLNDCTVLLNALDEAEKKFKLERMKLTGASLNFDQLRAENRKMFELLCDLNVILKTALHNGHHDLIERVKNICERNEGESSEP